MFFQKRRAPGYACVRNAPFSGKGQGEREAGNQRVHFVEHRSHAGGTFQGHGALSLSTSRRTIPGQNALIAEQVETSP